MIGIYKITSPNNRVYIGQSINIKRRWRDHRGSLRLESRLTSSFKKHGAENHIFEVLEECEVNQLNERERFYQDQFDVLGPRGLNSRLTKSTDRSGSCSEETKEKIRRVNLGKKHSEETKRLCSIKSSGYKHTDESKKKISKAHKGKKYSKEIIEDRKINVYTQEWRNKISKANKNNKAIQGNAGRKVIDTETKEVFDSIKLAANSISMRSDLLSCKLKGTSKNKTNFVFLKDYKTKNNELTS